VPYARRRVRRRSGTPETKAVLIARPAIPRSLTGEARQEWRRVVAELDEMGVVAAMDRALLIRYCRAWADWCELDDLLQRSSKLIRGQKNNLVRNPVWLMRRDADETVTELARQLGLSPMARLRAGIVHKRPPEPEDEERRREVIEHYRRALEEDPREVLRTP